MAGRLKMRRTRVVVALTGSAVILIASACGASGPADGSPSPTVAAAVDQTQLRVPSYITDTDISCDADGGGSVLLTSSAMDPAHRNAVRGAEIVTKSGKPVWFNQMPESTLVTNLRVQTYHGKPVLTWWQGTTDAAMTNFASGVDYIVDDHYRVIAAISDLGNGLFPELQEFRLTPGGQALITSRRVVPYDLTPVGGPKDGLLADYIVSVVDVATKKVQFQWDALQHIPLTDSYHHFDQNPREPFDYLTINSVDTTPDGDLLLSGRYTSTVYAVNQKSGDIDWQLGGKHSSFQMGPGTQFAFQHDAQFVAPDTIRLMNNNSAEMGSFDDINSLSQGPSSVKWIHLDQPGRAATLQRDIPAPPGVVNTATGNAQTLRGGNTFVSWGLDGRIAEYTADGRLCYSATPAIFTYRAFLAPWHAQPTQPPELTVSSAPPSVHAVWNGATDVASWRVLYGTDKDHLHPVATAAWNGLDTAIPLPPGTPTTGYFQVEAVNSAGATLAASSPTPIQ